jgi:hypothetical protein
MPHSQNFTSASKCLMFNLLVTRCRRWLPAPAAHDYAPSKPKMRCDQRERPAPHASILKWGNHLLVEDTAQPGRSPARGPKTIFWLNPVGGDRNRRSGPHRNKGACRARGFGPSYRVRPPLKADPTPRRRSTGLPMRFPEHVSREDHTATLLIIACFLRFPAPIPTV